MALKGIMKIFRMFPLLWAVSPVLIPVLLATSVFSHVFLNHENQMRFDTFYIPGDVEAQGYSENVMIRHIIDEIDDIRRSTSKFATMYEQTDMIPDVGQVDISVPGAGLSIKTILDFAESFFGISPNVISAEIIKSKPVFHDGKSKKLILKIRTNNGIVEQYDGKIEELIHHAGLYILKNMEPLTLGLYLDSKGEYKKLEELITYIETTQDGDESRAVIYLLKSYAAYGNNLSEDAYKYGKLALEASPNDMFVLGNLGYLELLKENYHSALGIYEKMLEIAPGQYVGTYTNLALALLELNRYDEALPHIDQARKIDPADFMVYALKGEYLRNRGEFDLAEINFHSAIDIWPDAVRDDPWFIDKYHKLKLDVRESRIN